MGLYPYQQDILPSVANTFVALAVEELWLYAKRSGLESGNSHRGEDIQGQAQVEDKH